MLKILLGAGLVLIVLGAALIPLPGPGIAVLAGGVILAASAAVLLRKGPERS
ncbi:hypothetical protein ACOCJ4_15335 [Knoellia sp. CPCC 206435]|uniref:hypothetical protein n=1 Tax=Knoellia terrae TaxID=3404797 RepID=UPI003B439EE7